MDLDDTRVVAPTYGRHQETPGRQEQPLLVQVVLIRKRGAHSALASVVE